jgi:hypothetical protein
MSTHHFKLYNEGLKISRLQAVFSRASVQIGHKTHCHFNTATGINPRFDAKRKTKQMYYFCVRFI